MNTEAAGPGRCIATSVSCLPRVNGTTQAHRAANAVLFGVVSGMLALAGAEFGRLFVTSRSPRALIDSLARWDGQHFASILSEGYTYQPGQGSRVAFFPAYPLIGRWVRRSFHLSDASALGLVSNGCFLAALVAMSGFVRARRALPSNSTARAPVESTTSVPDYTLLAMALIPITFFFRMAYSESMFLLVAIVSLYTMARRCPLPVIALAIGLVTAVRPVGVALLLPLAWHIGRESKSRGQALRRFVFILPLACWGVLAYMAFQYWKFGQPFAFALTQADWRIRSPGTVGDEILSLLSWQPVWSVYVPNAWGYWRDYGGVQNPLFNLQFANPIYFVGTAALVALGAWKRWLTAEEVLLSAGLLLIPYVTRAYEMCMASQGRFAAVVFPAYIVIGELLARVPMVVAVSLLAASACLMAAYAALFAAGYPLI